MADPQYNEEYSARYAFLWAYGGESRNSGLAEGPYRSASSLVMEALTRMGIGNPVVVDCGCGTGRTTGDIARLFPGGSFLAVDASPWQLRWASRILTSTGPIQYSRPAMGFTQTLAIEGRALSNVLLAQADAAKLPLESGCADVVVSVNLLDRVPDPRVTIAEFRRALRPGGVMVFTTPMNWMTASDWERYGPGAAKLLAVVRECGFAIDTWFDELQYSEIQDGRGLVHHLATLVLSARAV
jgi:SAM-dependent methyltransferase